MRDLLRRLRTPPFSEEQREQLRASTSVNSAGYDPWGLNLEVTERTVASLQVLYRDYFRVRATGLEHVPEGRVLLVANHSGQLPLDGMLIALAMLLEAEPPRIVRGMIARWFQKLPFLGTWWIRCGQVVGDPRNCVELLNRDQAIMVFPEGVGGSGKTWWNRYQLQSFGSGFVRIALETGSPIVPIGVIGGEETYPSLYNPARLAKMLGVPYIPITPTFPLLGPLGLVPLPVQVDLHFGEPIRFEGDWDRTDAEIDEMVDEVKAAVRGLIDRGLEARPELSRAEPPSWRGA